MAVNDAPLHASGATAAVQDFGARGGSIWFPGGQPDAAVRLLGLIASSQIDGINPRQFNLRRLQQAVRRAPGSPETDRLLTEALVKYATAVRSVPTTSEWTIVDRAAVQSPSVVANMVRQAAAAGTLATFVETMPWMHETYAGLRREMLIAEQRRDRTAVSTLRLNLNRARLLPAASAQRYVMVNIPAQRLYMYENGKVVDWMRVVVGKPAQPTPMMAALIRYTAVNPYWNLPSDLVAERIAPNVVKYGLPYLREKGYVVLSDWSENAKRVDPSTIDWKAVVAGRTEIRMRQNPGPANAMGRMKFMFPNNAGVYLHDTPNKELLDEPARLLSAGCVRLEDAPRLAKWLYGRPLAVTKGMKPEQHVDLERPVPVYLAYLTAVSSGNQAVFYDDIYGRDRARLASLRGAAR
ncbi:MAG: L,D-transpeptidase family protein [Pseudomonadota bacterium]|nr:L,D-transpeptidase family protein [Pseudomonadota bacterium]